MATKTKDIEKAAKELAQSKSKLKETTDAINREKLVLEGVGSDIEAAKEMLESIHADISQAKADAQISV